MGKSYLKEVAVLNATENIGIALLFHFKYINISCICPIFTKLKEHAFGVFTS